MEEQNKNLPATEKADSLSVLLRNDAVKARFESVLGKKAPGFMSSIISAVNANKDLGKADSMSIIRAAAIAAALDLPINPSLGFAHIVPYSGQAQFQMGYKGFVQLAMRTGQYKTINATTVCEGELISANRFTGDMVLDETKKTSDTIIGYVAYFRLINGFEKWFYMSNDEVTAHGKRYSQSFSNTKGRWKLDFDKMALKTVIKMLLSKYGILSIEMQTALRADQAVVKGDNEFAYPDGTDDEQGETSNAGKLADRMNAIAMAPSECPNSPDATIMSKETCDVCTDRPGCPVWAEADKVK